MSAMKSNAETLEARIGRLTALLHQVADGEQYSYVATHATSDIAWLNGLQNVLAVAEAVAWCETEKHCATFTCAKCAAGEPAFEGINWEVAVALDNEDVEYLRAATLVEAVDKARALVDSMGREGATE